MKILTTILTCSQTQIRADACLKTWIKDIKKPHSCFFYGDQKQSKYMDNTWNCSPEDGECRLRLPEKTYNMLKKSLQYEWDFLFKCDDDTYVNFNMLEKSLKKYDPKECLYLGYTLGKINDSIFSYITKEEIYTQELSELFKKNNGETSFFKDILPAKLIEEHKNIYKFRYAHGGAGYILTRSSVQKCLNSLQKFYKDKSKNEVAEDYSVGLALQMEGIDLQNLNKLYTPNPKFAKKDQSICVKNIIEENKITTHYVNFETMEKIHDFIKS